jgi:cytochrome c oxidase subunit 2
VAVAGAAAPSTRPRRAEIVVVSVLVAAFAAAGSWFGASYLGDRGLPSAATTEGGDVERVWRILLGFAGGIAGVVAALLLYAVVSGWRRQRGPEPEQTSGSISLELVYTAIPLAIVAVVFALAIQTWDNFGTPAPADSLRIDVTAFQWGWEFDYEGGPSIVGAQFDEPELVVPVNRSLALQLQSRDVIHSFFVPAFLTKLDVIPGRMNELVVKPDHEGTYIGHCAEFCGLDHARMNFTVRVVSNDEFEAWLAQARSSRSGSASGGGGTGG